MQFIELLNRQRKIEYKSDIFDFETELESVSYSISKMLKKVCNPEKVYILKKVQENYSLTAKESKSLMNVCGRADLRLIMSKIRLHIFKDILSLTMLAESLTQEQLQGRFFCNKLDSTAR